MTDDILSLGTSADQVADLKGRLMFLGLLGPPVGTFFDEATQAAVSGYQVSVGHNPPTGGVDEALWHQLCEQTDASGYRLDQALAGAYDGYQAGNVTVVEHERTDYRPLDIELKLDNLCTRVVAQSGHHAAGIGNACNYFESYAMARLKELDQEFSGSDYMKYFARHVTGSGGIELTKLLTAGLVLGGLPGAGVFVLTSIWIAGSMELERKIGTAAQQVLADKTDLRAAIPALCATISAQVLEEYSSVEKEFKNEVAKIIQKIRPRDAHNQHQPEMLDAYTAAWVQRLLDAGEAGLDHFIETEIGIPTDWVAVRDRIYHMLVEAFEDMALAQAKEFKATPFDAAGAVVVQSANPGKYATPQDVLTERDAERHRRAVAAADAAEKKLHQSPSGPQH